MKLDVIKHSKIYVTISSVAIALGLIAMVISWQTLGSPLKPAIDFSGGTRLSLELVCPMPDNCGSAIDVGVVRAAIADQGFTTATIQLVGKEGRGLLIQTGDLDVDQRTALQASLENALKTYGEIDPAKSEIQQVGPTIGSQLLTSGLTALAISFAGIALYLGIRFQIDYAIFAIVALFHDVLITSGVFAILGLTLGVEVDSLFIVAILTIIGFSVNDTVIIYDRLRENLKTYGNQYSFGDLVNLSVNQTLGRTINTSLTTLLPLLAIFIFGGSTLKFFALALVVGFSSGVYSSVFNASILLAWWRQSQSVTTNNG